VAPVTLPRTFLSWRLCHFELSTTVSMGSMRDARVFSLADLRVPPPRKRIPRRDSLSSLGHQGMFEAFGICKDGGLPGG